MVDEGVAWVPPGTPYAIGTDLFADWTYVYREVRRPQLRVTRAGDRRIGKPACQVHQPAAA